MTQEIGPSRSHVIPKVFGPYIDCEIMSESNLPNVASLSLGKYDDFFDSIDIHSASC